MTREKTNEKMNAWIRSQLGYDDSSDREDDQPVNNLSGMLKRWKANRKARLKRILNPQKDHHEK